MILRFVGLVGSLIMDCHYQFGITLWQIPILYSRPPYSSWHPILSISLRSAADISIDSSKLKWFDIDAPLLLIDFQNFHKCEFLRDVLQIAEDGIREHGCSRSPTTLSS